MRVRREVWRRVAGIGGLQGLDVLRENGTGEFRRRKRSHVGDGAERAAGVGVLRTGMHVKKLCGADKDDENHAEHRQQNPEGLPGSGAAMSGERHSLSGQRMDISQTSTG